MAKEHFFLELEPSEAVMKSWPHVVIVGGGFAGLQAAHRLAGKPVRVTLVDKRNFNLFQPLLYQVASGLVSEADVATPLRLLLAKAANVQVLLEELANPDIGEDTQHRRPDRLIVNAVLTVALLVALVAAVLPLPVIFMIGFAVAMLLNYPTIDEQKALLSRHAGNVLAVVGLIFAAGIFTGILSGTKMVDASLGARVAKGA